MARTNPPLWGVALLILAYATLHYFPPASLPLHPPPFAPDFWQRWFPDVPPWWLIARLALLATASWVTLQLTATPGWLQNQDSPPTPFAAAERRWSYLAIGAAASLIVSAVMLPSLGHTAQALHVLALPLPALLMYLGQPRARRDSETPWLAYGSVAGIVALWIVWRLPMAWNSPLVANATDTNMFFEFANQLLREAAAGGQPRQGVGSSFLLFGGLAVTQLLERTITPHWVQITQTIWVALSATAVGVLMIRERLSYAAPVVVATLLFSPSGLMLPVFLTLQSLGWIVPAVLLLLLQTVCRRSSPSGCVALGVVGGLGLMHPSLVPLTAVVGLVAMMHLPRLPRDAVLAGALCLIATILPELSALTSMGGATASYAAGSQMWSAIEAGYYGQYDPSFVEFQRKAVETPLSDIIAGVVLSPFATPRTALRLIGDCLYEPAGTVFAVVGIVMCLRHWRRRTLSLLMVLAVVALLPACFSSYDRPSLTRAMAFPVIMALLAGVGFEKLRAGIAPRHHRSASAAAIAAIILGGSFLFDRVHPRILASSALTIALDAVEAEPPDRKILLLESPNWDPLQIRLFVPHTGREVTVAKYAGDAELANVIAASQAELIFWSPGQEDQSAVGSALCRTTSSRVSLYSIRDSARLSRTLVASRLPEWRPPAQALWQPFQCGDELPSEGTTARAASRAAAVFDQQREPLAALDTLRAAGRVTFVQFELYDELARRLIATNGGERAAEAVYWARRAVNVEGRPALMQTLAAAHAADGDRQSAASILTRAEDQARAEGSTALADELAAQARRYHEGGS